MLDFALCRPWVDAPRVGGAGLLQYPFGGEGGKGLLTLSLGGKRLHWGSLPFERGCGCVDIFLGMLGHEDEVVAGGGLHLGHRNVLFLLRACLFVLLIITGTASLISFLCERLEGI